MSKLRNRARSSRVGRTRLLGILFLLMSLASLLLTLSTEYIIFDVTYLLCLFVGAFLIFYDFEKRVGLGAASTFVMSALVDLSHLMNAIGLSEAVVFVPDTTNAKATATTALLTTERGTIMLPELGWPLTHIYELRMGDLAGLSLEVLLNGLPSIITGDLQLAQDVEFKVNGSEVLATIKKPTFPAIYLEERLTSLYNSIGCPLSCSIGEAIAKCSKREVSYLGYTSLVAAETIEFRYMLSPK